MAMAPSNSKSQSVSESPDLYESSVASSSVESASQSAVPSAAEGGSPGPSRQGGSRGAALAADGSVANHMLGDQPAGCAKEDKLGFAPYVSAVVQFLTDSSTKIPLTLSVEGLWGSGKSSFMLQLQEALTKLGRKRIVSFNAWQYNADEGLWAAFIHEFDATMHRDLSLLERLRVRWRLLKLRLSWQDTVETIKTVIWIVASLFVGVAFLRYLWGHGLDAFQQDLGESGKADESTTKVFGLLGGVGGTVAALMLFLTQVRELFKSPASLEKTAHFLARQKYDSQLPLIHKITHDFNDLVAAYAGDEPVYVFIDDLDRCEYTRAADVMQALLMLLSSSPNVVLVMGLDRDKVAAALAAKQEGLLPYLYKVEPSEAYGVGMGYGQRFLEKFIQVTYILPTPSPAGLKAMINPDMDSGVEKVPESQKSVKAIRIVTGKDDSATLDRIIEMADVVFDHNPRNVKQFVNMFRLQAFIANETGLFGSSRVTRDSGTALSIAQLAKYIVLCMRWPEFVEVANFDPDLVEKLESHFSVERAKSAGHGNEPREVPEDMLPWGADKGLVELLIFGWPDGNFSLANVDFAALSQITPARSPGDVAIEPGDDPAPIGVNVPSSSVSGRISESAPRKRASQPIHIKKAVKKK